MLVWEAQSLGLIPHKIGTKWPAPAPSWQSAVSGRATPQQWIWERQSVISDQGSTFIEFMSDLENWNDVLCRRIVLPVLSYLVFPFKLSKVAEGKTGTRSLPCLLSVPMTADISVDCLFS